MNKTLILLIAFVPCVLCILIAGYLAFHGMEGWGWFLFVAVLCGGGISLSSKSDKDGDKEEVEI